MRKQLTILFAMLIFTACASTTNHVTQTTEDEKQNSAKRTPAQKYMDRSYWGDHVR